MSTLPQDIPSDDFDIYGHLLDYQQSEEGQADLAKAPKNTSGRTPDQARAASKLYRQRHPDAVKLRAQAQKFKRRLYEAQDGLCRWCGKPLDGKYEVDHIQPISKGGTNDRSNLCVCHPTCNRRKADRG